MSDREEYVDKKITYYFDKHMRGETMSESEINDWSNLIEELHQMTKREERNINNP
jgi:hypothetical protein